LSLTATLALILASTVVAQAQQSNLNLPDFINRAAPPIAQSLQDSPSRQHRVFSKGLVHDIEGKGLTENEKSKAPCVTPHKYLLNRIAERTRNLIRDLSSEIPPGAMHPNEVAATNPLQALDRIRRYIESHPSASREEINELLRTVKYRKPAHGRLGPFNAPVVSPNPIAPSTACGGEQPTTVKIGGPLNGSYESNILKADKTPNSGLTTGFGGNAVVTTGGVRPYDIAGFGTGTGSARYAQFSTRSLDVWSSMAFYQFYLRGTTYKDHELYSIEDPTVQELILAPNMVTFDTLLIGLQNQTAYTQPFRHETADLVTPQIILSRQNMSVFGGDEGNICFNDDPKKKAFCSYADVALLLGQAFSDQSSQQFVTFGLSATLGQRFENDWKLMLQTAMTDKIYDDFRGGRRDLTLQVGPTLSYATNLRNDPILGQTTLTFTLPMTYTANYSTVAAASWHGFVILPTLTFAFSPTLQFK
jgi:hypothetical protein